MVKPLNDGNLSARVYAALREALIAGDFGPGHRLVIHELAEQFGTSVTPVREACLRLTSERGLEVRSGRFFTVPELNLARYIEIRRIRAELEGLAAEMAATNVTSAAIVELSDIQARFEEARQNGNAQTAMELNRQFHFGVYRLSNTDILLSHIESLWVGMGPILKVYHEDIRTDYISADEHVHLIEALKSRDGKRVRVALQRDIERGGEAIMEYLTALEPAAKSG